MTIEIPSEYIKMSIKYNLSIQIILLNLGKTNKIKDVLEYQLPNKSP